MVRLDSVGERLVGGNSDALSFTSSRGSGTYSVKIKLLDGLGISIANVAVGKVQLVSGYVTEIGGYTFAF